jgi:hypothetical protein
MTDDQASPLAPPSDDEDLSGPSRIVADPDSPTSRLLEEAAQLSLERTKSQEAKPVQKVSSVRTTYPQDRWLHHLCSNAFSPHISCQEYLITPAAV